MEIGHFRLSNGDELIAIYNKSKTGYDLIEPLAIEELNMNGQNNIVLVQYNLSENEILSVHKNHVITFASVSDVIKDYYLTSIEYNVKFIENNKTKEILRVSGVMRDILESENNKIDAPFSDSRFIVLSPSSNTVN